MTVVYYFAQEAPLQPLVDGAPKGPSEGGFGLTVVYMALAAAQQRYRDFRLVLPGTQEFCKFFGIDVTKLTSQTEVRTYPLVEGIEALVVVDEDTASVEGIGDVFRGEKGYVLGNKVARAIAERSNPGDTFHLNGYHFALAAFLGRQKGINVVTSIHALRQKYFYDGDFLSGVEYPLDKLRKIQTEDGLINPWQFVLQNSDFIVPVSAPYKDELLLNTQGYTQKLLNQHERAGTLIPIINGLNVDQEKAALGFESEDFFKLKQELQKDYLRKYFDCAEFGDGKPLLMNWVHRLEPVQKNPELMLEAFLRASEARPDLAVALVMIGNGELEYVKKLVASAAAIKEMTNNRIHLDPHYTHAKRDEALRCSVLGLTTANYEPHGLAILQAMHAYNAALATDVGGHKTSIVPYNGSNIDKASGLLVAPEDPLAYAQGIIDMYDLHVKKPDVYRNLAKNAHDSVPDHNSMFKAYTALYCADLQRTGRSS